jgi:hypothetical protein
MTNKPLQVFLALSLAVFSYGAIGQQPNPKSEARLESLFKASEMPFVKIADSHYAAVVTTDDGVSDRFHVFLSTIGNDPNDEDMQVVQIVFYLGEIPQGSSAPIALIKQINEWNSSLSRGSVFIVGQSVAYQSSGWLFKSDPKSLELDALVGHYSAVSLRKEVEPYLKQ